MIRCIAGARCKDPHAPLHDLPLCEACLRIAEGEIRALVFDYADLEQHVPAATGHGEPVSGTREPTIPLNLRVLALQRAIWLATTATEALVREREQLTTVNGSAREGFAVQRAVDLLANRLPVLASLPSVTIGDEVITGAAAIMLMCRFHAAAHAVLGLTRLVHHLESHCPECRIPSLRRDDGSDDVYCAQCSFRCTWNDYKRHAIDWVTYAEDQWLEPAKAAEVAAVTLATLRVWRARGRLAGKRVGKEWRYRCADLLALRVARPLDDRESSVTLSGTG